MPGRDEGGRGDMGRGDMGRGDMGRGDMVEPEVEILRPSPSEMREYKHIMRKHKNINKRAQIFVQYFYKCLISAIEKKTDRHAADAWGGVRINHVPIPDSECGFDEKEFDEVIEYIYARYERTYCRNSKFWYKWDWVGLNRARGTFK